MNHAQLFVAFFAACLVASCIGGVIASFLAGRRNGAKPETSASPAAPASESPASEEPSEAAPEAAAPVVATVVSNDA